jgi:GNAT superfamily N-acetyltransferase
LSPPDPPQPTGVRPARPTPVRPAEPADVPAILALIRDLAEYERAVHEVVATEDLLREALFADAPRAHALVVDDPQGEYNLAGFALYFLNFSTWTGRHGIYLEDLYVRPERRGGGYGHALLQRLAALCVDRGYTRLEWSVLDWNEPALGFYRSLGAEAMDEWTVHRVAGDTLAQLATSTPPGPAPSPGTDA